MRRYDVQSVRRVFSAFFHVDEATVVDTETQEVSTRLSVERGDAAAVVVFDSAADEFFFVRQFRYPLLRHEDGYPLEIAAGTIESGETPEEAARREVFEELGFAESPVVSLGAFYPSPGGLSEKVYLFFAAVDGSSQFGGGGTEGENIHMIRIGRDRVWEMVEANEIGDGKTLLGLYRCRDRWEELCPKG